MKQILKDIFSGFKESPLATLCVLLTAGFAWIYNDLQQLNEEQRSFIRNVQQTQVLINESLIELNLRLENIEKSLNESKK